ncbi:MAG: FkbM family methyltransferase [Planctomycetes bacterium]|nr:FkbM family methyltransferase [Planctomycetota bacterium]
MRFTSERLERLLLRVRPAQVADLGKRLLGVRRRTAVSTAGLRFWVDPVSVFGAELLATGEFEPRLTALLTEVCRPGDVFLDVGGNEGYFTVLARTLVGPAGVVHSVEPQSRLRGVIEENIRSNGADGGRVHVHPVALVAEPGPVELYLRPSTNTGASSLVRHWRLGSAREVVDGVRLDDLLDDLSLRRVDVMKVDCEGAEGQVIAGGARSFASHRVGLLSLEHHPTIRGEAACRSLHERLLGWGYRWPRWRDADLGLYVAPGYEGRLSRSPGS